MNSLYIAINLVKRVFSDRKGWIVNLLLPTVILSMIVMLTGKEPDPITIGYVDKDGSSLSRHFTAEVSRVPNFRLVKMDEAELQEQIRHRKISTGFLIPPDFSERLLSGQSLQVQQYQSRLSEESFLLKQQTNQTLNQMLRSLETARGTGTETLLSLQEKHQVDFTVTDFNLYVPQNLSLVIGFLLYFVMGLILHAISFVVEDRDQHTMMRMYTAPVSSFEISLGNFLGVYLVGLAQVALTLAITKWGLGFDYKVPLGSLFAVLGFFLLATVGIGSGIAGFVRSRESMGSISSLVITPTCMLGGCWWPVSIMPDFMQKIANFVPQKWALEAITRLAGGARFTEMYLHLGILFLFAFVLLAFGSFVLKPGDQSIR